jgi:uncharacterized protein involved in exopolysaccharide biosynthesis
VDEKVSTGTMADYYEVERDRPEPWRQTIAVQHLRDDLDTKSDLKTSLITVTFRSRSPTLTRDVSNRILDVLNEYNLQMRSSQYSAERAFVEARLGEERDGLRSAELRLQNFLQHNRGYTKSPQLAFEYERLQREVTIQQQVYTALAQNFAQSRIEEARNTPAITVVQRPDAPAVPDSRMLALRLTIAIIIGLIIAVALALLRTTRRSETNVPSVESPA